MQAKKNLGFMQMQYKDVYVAYMSMRTNPAATVKAFNEAENYNGPYPPRRRRARRGGYAGCDHHRVRAHCIEQVLLTKTGPAHQEAVEKIGCPCQNVRMFGIMHPVCRGW